MRSVIIYGSRPFQLDYFDAVTKTSIRFESLGSGRVVI